MNYLINASSYLVDVLIGLALYAVLLRFWMQWVKADFRNPIGQFLITTTNPIVLPLRRILPSIAAIDTATVLLALAIAALKTGLLSVIAGVTPPLLNLLLFSVIELLRCSIYLFMAALIIGIIASWVNPHSYHPVFSIANSISNPLLAPFRRLIPPLGGLDISPIFVFLALNLALQFLDTNCAYLFRCFG